MEKGKRINLLLLPVYIIIPFLAFFLYSLVIQVDPISTVKANISWFRPTIKYDTFKISFDSSVPETLKESIKSSLQDINYNGKDRFKFVDSKGDYIVKQSTDTEHAILNMTLIPVGHLYWVKGSITKSELSNGSIKILMNNSDYDEYYTYLLDILGPNVQIEKTDSMVSDLKVSENSIGLVSPKELTQEMKVLKLDSSYYMDSDSGAIKLAYSLVSQEDDLDLAYSVIKANFGTVSDEDINRDQLVKINMTGVTAITRGLARKTDESGDYGYAARSIGEFLANADLTHVSNEISFIEGCTSYSGMRFCSRPEYVQALKDSGVDIVELTGNHNNDYGAQANTNTINTYKELGWDYFGGGLNSEDASKILYKEVKGSKIAFLGYNYYDTMLNSGAIASDTHAGSNSYSASKLKSDIEQAKQNADVVIVDFQFQECYSYPSSDVIYPICYKPISAPDQKAVFRMAIDDGANVVIGTQAHQPQTYEEYNNGLIFYGLGNLYFDQVNWIGTRQGLVLSLYITDGKLIQAELTPTIYGSDMITHIADASDSKVLLDQLKQARNF